jgi:hypothetical protein
MNRTQGVNVCASLGIQIRLDSFFRGHHTEQAEPIPRLLQAHKDLAACCFLVFVVDSQECIPNTLAHSLTDWTLTLFDHGDHRCRQPSGPR